MDNMNKHKLALRWRVGCIIVIALAMSFVLIGCAPAQSTTSQSLSSSSLSTLQTTTSLTTATTTTLSSDAAAASPDYYDIQSYDDVFVAIDDTSQYLD